MLRKKIPLLLMECLGKYTTPLRFRYCLTRKLQFSFSNDNKSPKGFEKFKREKKASPAEELKPQKKEKASNKEKAEKEPDQNTAEKEEATGKDKENKEEPTGRGEEEEEGKDPKNSSQQGFLQNLINKIKSDLAEIQKKKEGKNEENTDSKANSKDFGDKKKEQSFFNRENLPKILGFSLPLAALLAFYALYDDTEYITYNDFVHKFLKNNEVDSVDIIKMTDGNNTKNLAKVHLKSKKTVQFIIGNIDHFLAFMENNHKESVRLSIINKCVTKTKNFKNKGPGEMIPISFSYDIDKTKIFDSTLNMIYLFATIGLIIALYRSLKGNINTMGDGSKMGGQGMDIFNTSKANIRITGIDVDVKVKFKDVAGLQEAKQEISEFVDFLKHPRKYRELGARLPRGALLTGPPGTGKTMLAKACAGEAGVPFLFMSGSDFVEMFVGIGAARVRDLFKQAREKAPSIIFIDEIDAIGRKRENKISGSDEKDNTLNQLLVEMDGFGTKTNVIVLAATNRKELLDPALTRPGRFDRSIDVGLPDLDGRREIFLVHLKPIKLNPEKTKEEYARRLATLTPGFSGADIANLCNEAAILAARKSKVYVDTNDFEMAAERVIAGLERKNNMSEKEKRTVAVHESGHAVVSWFLEGGNPLLKVTIIPRSKGSLGYAQYLPSESSLQTKEELLDQISSILGGRIAEEEFFGEVTTGAYDDLTKAYDYANAMVSKLGMSEKVGYIGFEDIQYTKKHSEETQTIIDEEVKKIVVECSEKTRETIRKHRHLIEKFSEKLLQKESLDLRDIIEILGDRPWPVKSNFKAYIDTKNSLEEERKLQEENRMKEEKRLEEEKRLKDEKQLQEEKEKTAAASTGASLNKEASTTADNKGETDVKTEKSSENETKN